MIQHTESTLLQELRGAFPAYEVEPYAEGPGEYAFTHPKAALVPVLQEVTYAEGPLASRDERIALPEFNVALFTRGLSASQDADPGAYELMEATAQALEGLKVTPEDSPFPTLVLRIQREFFITSLPGGVWVFGQNYKLSES